MSLTADPVRLSDAATVAVQVTAPACVQVASAEVKVGDILEIMFGQRTVKVEVLSLNETVKKENAVEMYKDLILLDTLL